MALQTTAEDTMENTPQLSRFTRLKIWVTNKVLAVTVGLGGLAAGGAAGGDLIHKGVHTVSHLFGYHCP